MNTALLTTFIISTSVIVAVPGPNIMLIINDSVRSGFRKSIATILGIKSGMLILLGLSLAGFAALLERFSFLFTIIKWAGAAYLIYLGITQIILSASGRNKTENREYGTRSLFLKGFLISISNPKGLLFAGAFFPQFLDRSAPLAGQVIFLLTLNLIISMVIELVYAAAAGSTGKLFRNETFSRYVSRISGGFLVFFGAGLALLKSGD